MSIKKTIEIEAIAKDAIEQIQALNKKVEGLEDALSDAGKETKKTNKILGGLSGLLKGGLGLSVVVKGFELLKETFMSNQKVADLFSTGMEALSLVFNQVVNAVVKGNGEFDALGTILKNVLNIGLAPFKLAIEGITIAVKTAQLAWAEFTGGSQEEIFELQSELVQAKDNIVEIGTGVIDSGKAIVENFDKAVDSIKKISISAAIEQAKQNVELQKSAELAEAQNRIILEQKDREAEKLRQIRDDESKTIAERIEANNNLAEVLNEQERLMLANADAVLAAAQAQFDKNKNDENQIALLEAQAEKEGILAQIEGFRSEQLTNINSLERERQDLIDEAKQKDLDYYEAAAEAAIKAEEEKAKAKEQATANAIEQDKRTLNSIVELAGKGSDIGKAAAVAQVTVAGIEGVQNAYKTAQASPITALFPAYPVIQAGLAAAFAGVQLKSILATPKPSKSGGGGSSSSPRVPSPSAPTPPAFNVVGASETNQLAQSIGQEEKQPVKAYVVSNDVSNAQALDRNIVRGASIG
jgi:hypothetical protein